MDDKGEKNNYMIVIWGQGSSGSRYKNIANDLGYTTKLLKRQPNGDSFDFDTLDLSEIEAAIICTPTVFHKEQSIKFLENNIPVLCEKPIAHTYQAGREIIEVATKYDTKFMVGYNQRSYTAYRKFQDPRWGKPTYAESKWCELVSGWHPHEDYRESYAVRPDLGGGVPLTLSHDFDWWTGLFGDLNVLTVHHSSGALDVEIPTSYDIVLENNDKSVMINMHLDYEASPPERYYKVEYENGVLLYNPIEAYCNFTYKDGRVENILIASYDNERRMSFVNTFVKFMDEIATPSHLSDWELGLTALELADTVENWK
jgi:predicted dehydrogenase